jgi:glutamate dehydrogenase/leucine dehydrogenase
VYFAEEMLKTRGDCFQGKTVAISGSGNVAQYAAEKATAKYFEGSVWDYDGHVDIALPCATQNEIDADKAARLVKNVNDRIKLYFGEAYGVQIISAPDEGTTARIYFPMRRQEDEIEK